MDSAAGWLIALALVAVVGLAAVLAVVSLARTTRDDAVSLPNAATRPGPGGSAAPAGRGDRESLLKQRYSRGDIGLEEYRREMRALHEHG